MTPNWFWSLNREIIIWEYTPEVENGTWKRALECTFLLEIIAVWFHVNLRGVYSGLSMVLFVVPQLILICRTLKIPFDKVNSSYKSMQQMWETHIFDFLWEKILDRSKEWSSWTSHSCHSPMPFPPLPTKKMYSPTLKAAIWVLILRSLKSTKTQPSLPTYLPNQASEGQML